jgi:hypothetical protein
MLEAISLVGMAVGIGMVVAKANLRSVLAQLRLRRIDSDHKTGRNVVSALRRVILAANLAALSFELNH